MKWLLTLLIVVGMSAECPAGIRSVFGRVVKNYEAQRSQQKPAYAPRELRYWNRNLQQPQLYKYHGPYRPDGLIELEPPHPVRDVVPYKPLNPSPANRPRTRSYSPSRSSYWGDRYGIPRGGYSWDRDD